MFRGLIKLRKRGKKNSRVLVIHLKCNIIASQLLRVSDIESLASPKAFGAALQLRVIQNDRAWKPFNFLTIRRFNLAKPRFRLFFPANATGLRQGYGVVDVGFRLEILLLV